MRKAVEFGGGGVSECNQIKIESLTLWRSRTGHHLACPLTFRATPKDKLSSAAVTCHSNTVFKVIIQLQVLNGCMSWNVRGAALLRNCFEKQVKMIIGRTNMYLI